MADPRDLLSSLLMEAPADDAYTAALRQSKNLSPEQRLKALTEADKGYEAAEKRDDERMGTQGHFPEPKDFETNSRAREHLQRTIRLNKGTNFFDPEVATAGRLYDTSGQTQAERDALVKHLIDKSKGR